MHKLQYCQKVTVIKRNYKFNDFLYPLQANSHEPESHAERTDGKECQLPKGNCIEAQALHLTTWMRADPKKIPEFHGIPMVQEELKNLPFFNNIANIRKILCLSLTTK